MILRNQIDNFDNNEIIKYIYENFKSLYLSRNFPVVYYSDNDIRCQEILIENREEVSYLMYVYIKSNYSDLYPNEIVGLALKINELKINDIWEYNGLFNNYHNGLRLLALQASTDQLENLEFDYKVKNKSLRKMELLNHIQLFENKHILTTIMNLLKTCLNYIGFKL